MPQAFRAAAILAMCSCVLAPLQAQSDGREAVVIRAYDTFGVASSMLRVAENGVVASFDAAGINVQWNTCHGRRSASLPAACAGTLTPRDVVVRIVTAPRAARDRRVLGFSYVDARAKRGTLGTVYMDRVIALAFRLRADAGQLLGSAITHEVAHLLLGTPAHSADGVMRARWLQNRDDATAWRFSPSEAADLRTAVTALPLSASLHEIASASPPPASVTPSTR